MNISPATPQAYKLLHNGVLALSRAEQQGLRVDLPYIIKTKEYLTSEMERIDADFKKTTFFKDWTKSSTKAINVNSGDQLAEFLYKTKGIKPPRETKSGKGSTNDETMKELNIPELNELLKKKQLKKLRDYLNGFEREQVNGYIHPVFNLHLAQTFRSSSDSPNFQNMPNRDKEAMKIVRSAIYPRPGHMLMEADFSGIEVRSNACINKDKNLIKYIEDPTTDMHGDMAEQLFKLDKLDKSITGHGVLRQAAKNAFVFPEFYGSYYKNCAEGLVGHWGELPKGKWKPGMGIPIGDAKLSDHLIAQELTNFDKFVQHVKMTEEDFWGNRFIEYAEWKDKWWKQYQKKGYFDIPTGFRCVGLMDKKQVCNYPGQGSAFHCLLWSFIASDARMQKEKWDTRLVGQIHDSIVLDVHPDEKDYIKEAINQILTKDLPKAFDWIIVPMEIEIAEYPVDGSFAEKIKD